VPLASGMDFGSYHLIRPLGQGGFAEVWEAESGASGRRVALKVLTQLPAKSTNALERFRQEGRLAASLYHPRCVYVFDAGAVGGVPYISMELMPGGTLADRIKLGPLPVATAVDYVIDMLDGLEAAHAAGIIHRDIKPSNVFLDEDGRARIGDFGISKSLESTAALTATGGFLGTPQYASPEQAGGEAIDSRSDLYSAGTVLYELLTGEAPFGAENSAQALARVLTQSPPSFPAQRSVPPGLQRVVYRLLAKQKEKRYATSRAARAALAPYSSHGATTADLARRFAAFAVDLLLFFIFGLSTSGFGFRHPLAGPAISLSAFTVYYAFLEGLTGASVGKRLTGLRVVTPAGGAPTFARVALRSILFIALYFGLSQLLPRLLPPSPWTSLAALVVSLAVIVSTMRRANGFAGLHEVLSGTRVVALQRLDRAGEVPDEPPVTTPVPDPAPAFGPYRPTGVVWSDEEGYGVYVAHDDELRRDVWIHAVPARARCMLPATDELRARGAGYLPWLQRGDAEGRVWDAYGAPRGVLLTRWADHGGGPIGWAVMRRVLSSLGRALGESQARGATGVLSPYFVWVDRSGHAQLLDFPLEVLFIIASTRDWDDLLRQVTALGLTGSLEADGPPRVPLPMYARALLSRLWGQGPAFAGAADFAAALDQTETRPTAIPRARRVATLAIPAIWPAMVLLVALINPGSRSPPWLHDLTGSRAAYLTALRRPPPSPGDTAARRATQSIEIVLASALTQARADRNGGQVLSFMAAADSALLDTLARRHPAVTAVEADTARAWLAAHRAAWMDPKEMTNRSPLVEAAHAFAGVGVFGIAAVVLALMLRGPPLLHLAGISVALTDGVPAGRVRSALRSLVAWAPWIALFVVARGTPPLAVEIALAAIGIVGAVYAFLHAERGVPDRVMRTVLVPK
jgi:eukaryotic-like serine/threonine-protein kinase